MYSTTSRDADSLRRENARLQSELDDIRMDREREYEQRATEREQRQRAFREETETALRSASDWPEAFRKNIYLMERERNQCHAVDDVELIDGWNAEIRAIRYAATMWQEAQAEIDKLVQTMRLRIADRLEENGTAGTDLVQALRNDDIDSWLNW